MPVQRGIAQLVEQRSPKPRVLGSNPSTPVYINPPKAFQTLASGGFPCAQNLELSVMVSAVFGRFSPVFCCQSIENAVFFEVPYHWLDIAEGKLFQQFHRDHRPSDAQRYHTSRRKSRNIFVNSAGVSVISHRKPDGSEIRGRKPRLRFKCCLY